MIPASMRYAIVALERIQVDDSRSWNSKVAPIIKKDIPDAGIEPNSSSVTPDNSRVRDEKEVLLQDVKSEAPMSVFSEVNSSDNKVLSDTGIEYNSLSVTPENSRVKEEKEVLLQDVKSETPMFASSEGISLDKALNVTYESVAEIKKEEEELRGMTDESVGYNKNSDFVSKCHDYAPEVKCETNGSKNEASIHIDNKSVVIKDMSPFEPETLNIQHDSNQTKKVNSSMEMEDHFSSDLRKNEELFLCVYCSGVIRRDRSLQCLPESHQNWEPQESSASGAQMRVPSSKNPNQRRVKLEQNGATMNELKVNSENGYACNECNIKYSFEFPLEEHLTIKKEDDLEVSVTVITNNSLSGTPENSRDEDENEVLPQDVKCETPMLVSSETESSDSEGLNVTSELAVRLEKENEELAGITFEKPYRCTHCSKTFRLRAYFKQHLKVHSNERSHPCKLCPAKFKTNGNLRRHQSVHCDEKPFKCPVCGKRCSCLKSHLRTHSGERPFECKQCLAKFTNNSNLNRHLRTHSNEKRFKCDQCPATFIASSYLKRHLSVHSGEKQFECDQCCRKFRLGSNLKKHVWIHSRESLFQCKQCPAKFKQRDGLKGHMAVHMKETPFHCSHCPAKFKRKYGLRNHLMVHSCEKPYTCNECPAKYKRKNELRKHCSRAH